MQRILTLLSSLVVLAVPAGGAAATLSAPDAESAVVAVVNGESILADDIVRHLVRVHGEAGKEERSNFDVDGLMFKMVNDVLIGQEARFLEMNEDPRIREKVERRRLELARERLERIEVTDHAVPTESEVRESFELQHRTVTFRVVTGHEKEEAEQLLADLRSGADVATLAEGRSVDPYRVRGGLVDNVTYIDLQREIGDLVFSLQPGQIAGPVQTDLGWSVVRLESKKAADPERFAVLERGLRNLVAQQKAAARRQALAKELRSRHAIEVKQEVVAAMKPEPSPDGRLVPVVEDPTALVATVGESGVVTAMEYGQALRTRWKRVRNMAAAEASAPLILQRLLEERLMTAEALARGYAEVPRIEKSIHAYETQLLISPYLQEMVAKNVEVTAEEMRTYYDGHKKEFHRPPRIRLGQISVASLKEAEYIAAQLRKGADLAWLARQHSLDGYKERGGDRGWLVPEVGTEDFQRELFDAEIGTVLEPFEVLGGFIVAKVTGKQDQGIYEFGEISGNIRQRVFSTKFQLALDRFITTLRSRSEIEIDTELLASLTIVGSVEDMPQEGESSGGHHN